VRTKLIDDTKKRIKQILRNSRFVKDQESHAILEDKEATGYLDLKVSGDEESDAKDINSDPEAGEQVEVLEARWDGDD